MISKIFTALVLLIPFTSLNASPNENYSFQAIEAMNVAGYDLKPSLPYLSRFSNIHQVHAVKILVNDNRGEMVGKMPGIPNFNNAFSVEALRLMVNYGREIAHTIYDLAQVTNQLQVDAIRILLEDDRGDIRGKMYGIIRFNNSFQLEALRNMVAAGYEIDVTIGLLAQITNGAQVNVINELLRSDSAIRDNMPYILSVKDDSCKTALDPDKKD